MLWGSPASHVEREGCPASSTVPVVPAQTLDVFQEIFLNIPAPVDVTGRNPVDSHI